MYLKQVELENFKSFGGKTTVPLMEGYMAVTGPNGSGKSNIADAILFVLGPKSAKAVRAGRLSDLVFDGAGKGKAKYTKVSLVFDNIDRLMPWDDDTVRLTRYIKLADNGTDYSSYFFINDQKSSLTEFDTLLTKARISADGYNLVQQGDVVNIVSMGGLERRRILDGISGIASFDADIGRAQTERVAAAGNLDRIEIIRGEQERQLKALEKDREVARQYVEVQQARAVAAHQLTSRQRQNAEARLTSLNGFIAGIDQKINGFRAAKMQAQADGQANERALADMEAQIDARAGPEYRQLKTDIENTRIAMATEDDRAQSAVSDRQTQEGFCKKFQEAIADNRREYAADDSNLSDLKIKAEAAESRLQAAKDAETKISQETSRHGGELTKLQQRLGELEISIDAASKSDQDAAAAAGGATAVAEAARRAKADADERLQSARFAVKDADWNLQEVKRTVGPADAAQKLGEQVVALRHQEAQLEKQEDQLKEAAEGCATEYNRLAAEKRVAASYDSRNGAVTEIIGLRNRGEIRGIYGTVAELATVTPGFETALSVAAGGKMQAVIVDTDATAAGCIEYLKKNSLGRVTFLPLSKMVPGKPRAKAIMIVKRTDGYATDLIKFDSMYENAFWYVFQDTLVVDSLDSARELMGGVRLVTKAGELVEASGAMVGGTINKRDLPRFGPSAQSELDQAGESLRRANEALDGLRTQLRQLRDQIRAADDQMHTAAGQSANAQGQIAAAQAKLDQVKKDLPAVEKMFADSVTACEAAEQTLKEAQGGQARTAEALCGLRAERDTARARVAEIAPAGLQERIQKARDAVYAAQQSVGDLRGQCSGLKADMVSLDKQKEGLDIQLAAVTAKIDADVRDEATHSQQAGELKVKLTGLKNIERDMDDVTQGLRAKRDALLERKYQFETSVKEAQTNIETQDGIRSTQVAQAELARQDMAQLDTELAQIKEPIPQPIPSEEELKRTLKTCDANLAAFGNVNLKAIEDYDARKTEYDALTAQVDQLNKQIADLDKLTKDLTARKKGLFMQAYDAVNVNFRTIYAQLSGGGEGFMALDDSDDPFQGGLQINAKPRNGKMLRLEALSGGEKSLTALAFIFAIQEYQPSPFYVLDEVDMFLDAVNAELVAKRIKESSAKAQFIQVSLRKVTLTLADHLIGVTRPPSGISRVIIQPDLAEVAKYEEEALRRQKQQHAAVPPS